MFLNKVGHFEGDAGGSCRRWIQGQGSARLMELGLLFSLSVCMRFVYWLMYAFIDMRDHGPWVCFRRVFEDASNVSRYECLIRSRKCDDAVAFCILHAGDPEVDDFIQHLRALPRKSISFD